MKLIRPGKQVLLEGDLTLRSQQLSAVAAAGATLGGLLNVGIALRRRH